MPTITELNPVATRVVPWWKRPYIAAAAAIVVVVVLVLGSFWLGASSENVAPASDPAEQVVPDASLPAAEVEQPSGSLGQAEARFTAALAVVDRLYDAYDRGDVASITALLADADITGYTSIEGFAWDLAQGSEVTDRTCEAPPDSSDIGVTCTMNYQTALGRAAGAAPIELITMASISSQGDITFFNERLSASGEVDALIAYFEDWVSAEHPEDAEVVVFGRWESIEQATRGGELRAQYVNEYADYLEANGCSFAAPCVP